MLCIGVFASSSWAQLADGTTSPDFTLTDLNGATHSLYANYLDNNIHTVLDFSATWCPPCWNYHQTKAIGDFYDAFGPTTGSGVAMTFMMEADASTNTACLYGPAGCNGTTMGDWVTGTTYPILDSPTSAESSAFQIGYWPTIYIVNGYDNRIFECGQIPAARYEDWLESFELEVVSEVIVPQDCTGNGSISLATTGGFGSTNYVWSNGQSGATITDLAAGDYSVTITDSNGYFVERGPYTVTIDNTNGSFNVVTLAQVDVTCNGYNDGFLLVDVPGETDISYQWSNGSTSPEASGLNPGSHSLLVTNTIGCNDSRTFTITEPLPMVGSSTYTDPTCSNNNGTITLNVSGGTAPYAYEANGNYSANNFFENLPANLYTVVAYDINNCAYFEYVELEGDPVPTAMSEVNDVLDCMVSEVELSAAGSSSNSQYNWFDSNGNNVGSGSQIMVSDAGDYDLVVTDSNGCTSMSSVTVEENYSAPTISTSNATLTCTASSVQLCMNVSGESSSYWEVNGQQINQLCVDVDAPGTYTAVAESANGCQSTSDAEVNVDVNVPVAQIESAETLTCVLTNQIITADLTGNVADHTINWSTSDGNIVSQVSALEIEIDAPGLYEVNIVDNNSGCELNTNVLVDEFINTPESDFSAVNDDDFLHMEDLSIGGPTAWEWTVDGAVVSNSATYAFPLTGDAQHTVCLTITNECTTDTKCNTVSIVPALSSTSTIEQIDCNGDNNGSILVEVEGGVAPYEVEVAGPNGFSGDQLELNNLAPGEYEFTIRDSETRVMVLQITISEPTVISSSQTSQNPLCNATETGSIELEVEGGTGDYTYEWSNGATTMNIDNLGAGTYAVVITDENKCTSEESVVLTQPNAIEESGVVQNVNCFGDMNGSISLSVTGGTGALDLSWTNGLEGLINTNLGPGTYDLMIVDENECSIESSYTITQPDELVYATENVEDDFNGDGGSIDVSVSGGVTPYDFVWSNGETTEDISNLSAGEYSLEVIDANGCSILTEMYIIEFVSNVNEISSLQNFEAYPNPTTTLLNVVLDFENAQIGEVEIIDNIGREVLSKKFEGSAQYAFKFEMQQFAAGTYLLRIQTENGIAVRKISLIK